MKRCNQLGCLSSQMIRAIIITAATITKPLCILEKYLRYPIDSLPKLIHFSPMILTIQDSLRFT